MESSKSRPVKGFFETGWRVGGLLRLEASYERIARPSVKSRWLHVGSRAWSLNVIGFEDHGHAKKEDHLCMFFQTLLELCSIIRRGWWELDETL